ncbi:phytanoyl-CoA dioxygenase family protein [Candidatus Poribacteria bacterium]|nr:phytanoyl-CoA dioxygenase family protein [Candidatus Poribacteria bacterium]
MTIDTSALQRDFNNTGFAIVPNLFSRDEAQRLKHECIDILTAVKEETGNEIGHGVYVGLAARSPVFQDAVGDGRLLDVLEKILAPNIEFLSDKVVFKSEDMTFASPWHQDWHYWHGAHKFSIWVALDDATVENGCLKLFPGSHKSAIVHDGDASDGNGFGNRLRPDAIDESLAVTAEVEAGGAVFFHDLTLHSSHPNLSGAERWVWIPTYRDAKAEDNDYPWAVAAKVVRGNN